MIAGIRWVGKNALQALPTLSGFKRCAILLYNSNKGDKR
jgi:hypothetical protein